MSRTGRGPRYRAAMRARVGVPLLLLLCLLALPPVAAAAGPGYGPVQFVDKELAGGEPLVFYDAEHKSYIYTAHEGTTHLYRPGLASPFEFVPNYRNQVNIWFSKNGGKTWTRDNYAAGFQTPPAQNQGFSDPDLTQDAGGRVYNTGIDLANDALFSTNDGGVTWDRGTAQCHDGDRPWLAGANRDQVFMATDAVEESSQGSGHTIYESKDGGQTCGTSGIPDFGSTSDGGSYTGYGKLYWNPRAHKLVEPVLYSDSNGNQNAIGASTWQHGQSKFNPVKVASVKVFAHFPITIFDRDDRLYLIWDTDARQAGTTGGCGTDTPKPATNAIQMAVSKDLRKTWSKPRTLASISGKRVFWPWAVAGDRGELSVVYYVSDRLADQDCQDSNVSIYETRVSSADAGRPVLTTQDVAKRPVHRTSTVCQGGTTCVATGQDRRLGDFFTNATDKNGCVMVASGDTTIPSSQTGGPRPTSLPILIRQTSGASLTGIDCATGKRLANACPDRIRPNSRVTRIRRSRRGISARGRA